MNEEKLRDAFNLFDTDKNGKISKKEIKKVLKMGIDSKELDEIMAKHDMNKDGEIDFKEFMIMMEEI